MGLSVRLGPDSLPAAVHEPEGTGLHLAVDCGTILHMTGATKNSSCLLVLAAALCFATTGTAQELGPAGLEPVAVGAARIAVGGALLALFAWWLGRRRPTTRRVSEMAPAA